jgi:hypothetical protein
MVSAFFAKIGSSILKYILTYGGRYLMTLAQAWWKKYITKKKQTKATNDLKKNTDEAPVGRDAERDKVEEDYINS